MCCLVRLSNFEAFAADRANLISAITELDLVCISNFVINTGLIIELIYIAADSFDMNGIRLRHQLDHLAIFILIITVIIFCVGFFGDELEA